MAWFAFAVGIFAAALVAYGGGRSLLGVAREIRQALAAPRPVHPAIRRPADAPADSAPAAPAAQAAAGEGGQ